ncbi:hypothetical protein MMC29_007981 [Sticta canariensis]|nr:hypothetical protein [Sticta canariensis]
MSKHSIDNEYYSTLELVVNDQDANAPELLTNASHKDTPNARPDLFLSTSAPEVLVPPEKEVCISPSQPGREKQSKQKLRILALVVVLLIVLGVGIGTGVGVGMNNHKSSNQTFTSTATAAFGSVTFVYIQLRRVFLKHKPYNRFPPAKVSNIGPHQLPALLPPFPEPHRS